MCHLRAVPACQQTWGAFRPDGPEDDIIPHPQAPPSLCVGSFEASRQLGIDCETSLPLLEALRDLQIVTDESVWHTVTEFIEPLEVFRNTVKRWGAERAATAPGPDVPDNVILLLDPQLLSSPEGSLN